MEADKAQLKGELPAVALLRYRAAGCLTHLLEAFRKCTGSVYPNQSNMTQKSLPQSLLGQGAAPCTSWLSVHITSSIESFTGLFAVG